MNMENRLQVLFKKKKRDILSIFFTAGFPTKNDTHNIARYLEEAGADIIEIGIPFSDPVADGPTIQASNKIALEGGMTLQLLLEQLKEIRKEVKLPIVLMGYLNPVMQYGADQFIKDAKKAGADGLIIPDLPLAVFQEQYQALFQKEDLCMSFLISPTTSEERISKIDEVSTGFVYAVSASSTTGAKGDFRDEQIAYFEKLSKLKMQNPYLIGFGIHNYNTYNKACEYSAGAIVGSAFISMLEKSTSLKTDINDFILKLRKEK